MTVDPCGAELTGSRTVTACWGGTTTRGNWPTVSWDVRPGELSALATTRTLMACCSSPFWIDTGTCPEEPPVGTSGTDLMILTFFSALSREADRPPARDRPCAFP